MKFTWMMMLLLAAPLAACGNSKPAPEVPESDGAGDVTEDVTEGAGDVTEDVTEGAGEAVEDTTDPGGEGVEDPGESATPER